MFSTRCHAVQELLLHLPPANDAIATRLAHSLPEPRSDGRRNDVEVGPFDAALITRFQGLTP
jgi:hypothetical protein